VEADLDAGDGIALLALDLHPERLRPGPVLGGGGRGGERRE
jgi:hypothetical protein